MHFCSSMYKNGAFGTLSENVTLHTTTTTKTQISLRPAGYTTQVKRFFEIWRKVFGFVSQFFSTFRIMRREILGPKLMINDSFQMVIAETFSFFPTTQKSPNFSFFFTCYAFKALRTNSKRCWSHLSHFSYWKVIFFSSILSRWG